MFSRPKVKVTVVARHAPETVLRSVPPKGDDGRSFREIGRQLPGQHPIVIEANALRAMQEHTNAHANEGEVGGMLYGHFCVDGDVLFPWVEQALPADEADTSHGAVVFTPESLLALDARREVVYPDLQPVGWYHSHPGFGVFMSGIDLGSHRTVFSSRPFVAVVLDPKRDASGVFGWLNGDVEGPLAFWLALDE